MLDNPSRIHVSGKYAYVVASADDGLEILDVSDPSNPTHVGSINDSVCDAANDNACELAGAIDIHVSGKYAYIAGLADNGVEILDISNVSNPVHAGSIADDSTTAFLGTRGIYVSGKYAYVTGETDDGVEVLDISNASNPISVGSINDTICDVVVGGNGCELDKVNGIYVSGKYAYITGVTDNGVTILDIGGIDAPAASIGNIETTSLSVTENAIVGNNLYVQSGLNVGPRGILSDGPVSFDNGTLETGNGTVTVTGDLNVTGTSYLGDVTVSADNITVNGIVSKDGNISFYNNSGSETVRITNNGKVGIGTTSPSSKLEVQGAGLFNDSAGSINLNPLDGSIEIVRTSGIPFIDWKDNNSEDFDFRLQQGGANSMGFSSSTTSNILFLNGSSGNVGIGTTSSDGTLHVHTAPAGAVTAVSGADDFIVENSVDAGISILGPDNAFQSLAFGSPADAVGAKIRWTHDEGTLEIGSERLGGEVAFFSGNFVEAARFDSAGKLGIGTSGPLNQLHVYSPNNAGGITIDGASNPALTLRVDNITIGYLASVDGDGNYFTDAVINDTILKGEFGLKLGVGSDNSSIAIDSSGNVGIGTTSPTTELEVVGDIISAGTKWTSRTSAKDEWWMDIIYGNGMFVAVGYNGGVMTSPDGVTWTNATAAASDSWKDIVYGNGLFVAVSMEGTVMTSPDGVTWTSRSSAESNTWYSVTYGNGTFVAVSTDGTNRVMTSPDGMAWTARSASIANSWYDVTYGNGLFVAVAAAGPNDNRVMTSPDGITWTNRTNAARNDWQSVTYGNGKFVAVGDTGSGNRAMYSIDGITWYNGTSAADDNWYSVTYGKGLFVATSIDGTVMTSSNGMNWTSRTAAASNTWYDVTYGNGVFVAVSQSGTGDRVMTSGKPDRNIVPHNNIYQGGMEVRGDLNVTGTSYLGDVTLTSDNITVNNILPKDGGVVNVDGNLTLGQRIVFALGGFIQNIVSGQIDINGTLNVTGGLNVDNGTLFVNETNDRVGIGTTTPEAQLTQFAATPEHRLISSGDNNSARITRTDSQAEAVRYNTVNFPDGVDPYSLELSGYTPGTNDYILGGNIQSNFTDEASFSIWIKLDNQQPPIGQNHGIAELSSVDNWQSYYPWTDGTLHIGFFAPTNLIQGFDNTGFDKTQWHHLAVTTKPGSGNYKLYQNGVFKTSGTGPATIDFGTRFIIGADPNWFLDGLMDDARIYNRELSQAEITTLANGGDPSTTGLLVHWKFNEGSGTVAIDSSGNGNNGTFVNSPAYTTSVPSQNPSPEDGDGDAEAEIWSSQDGVASGEKGIHSFGDPEGRTVLRGTTVRFNLGASETEVARFTESGNVGIGTTTPSTKLEVNGSINITNGELWINGVNNTAPDYVFEEKYDLMNLEDLGVYIGENKKLPDSDVQGNFFNAPVTRKQYYLLEKVEEIILHIFKIDDKVDILKEENMLMREDLCSLGIERWC